MTKRLFILLSIVGGSALSICGQARPTPTPTPAPDCFSNADLQPTANLVVAIPSSRIAVIDTSVFSDEKAGISRVIDAAKSLENEFRARQQELQAAQARLTTRHYYDSRCEQDVAGDPDRAAYSRGYRCLHCRIQSQESESDFGDETLIIDAF